MKIGLKRIKEFEIRIPRAEIEEIESAVKKVAKEVDPKLQLETCGSYRRGATSCGDIDILITHPDYSSSNFNEGRKLFKKLVEELHASGLLTDDLALGPSKYMGVCKLAESHEEQTDVSSSSSSSSSSSGKGSTKKKENKPEEEEFKFKVPTFADVDSESDSDEEPRTMKFFKSGKDDKKPSVSLSPPSSARKKQEEEAKKLPKRIHRRIDLRFLPVDAYPAGLLYFTGSDTFNRDMRNCAIEHGFTSMNTACIQLSNKKRTSRALWSLLKRGTHKRSKLRRTFSNW
eukprot:TRINITY_DN4447_c0_g1_i2.p1 TRINITY_DN4447_c0_g1~~TRINITY_DN4447_c0_g1_i2.p1  ORF type:complete len:287 (-),score=72.21 TRINITY_DN4447_c0_g1_i2:141-1001(-)